MSKGIADELITHLADLFAALDNCPRIEQGAGGMTIDAQLRRTVVNRVPAYLVENAREAYYAALTSPSPAQGVEEQTLWVARIAEVLDEGDGFWRSCSGCHELNEGHPTGDYSAAFRAHVGCGCSECGGLGVVWDDTDYADMGDFLGKELPAAPAPAPNATVDGGEE